MKDKKWIIHNESLKEKEEILNHLKTLSEEDIAAMLIFLPEQDRWTLLRDVLLSLRSEVEGVMDESPLARAIEYLYILVRFVETSLRYPSREEQDELFQELKSEPRNRITDTIVMLLKKASQSPKSRKAARQLRERQRSYRTDGQALPDAPKRYEGGADD